MNPDPELVGLTETAEVELDSEPEENADDIVIGDSSGNGCPKWCDLDLWDTLEASQQVFLNHLNADSADDVPIPDPKWMAAPREALKDIEITIYAIYDHFGADRADYARPEVDAQGRQYHDMLFPDYTSKLIIDEDIPQGCVARLRVYEAVRRAVVEREDDILTKVELEQHKNLVSAGIREELITWIQHTCFERRWRNRARNILDVKWVPKWKFVKAASVGKGYAGGAGGSATGATGKPAPTNAEGKVKVIRMRMTLRGFK